MHSINDAATLFRYVTADKAALYRCIMDVFATAKRQYRLQLRPDEVLTEARWPNRPPRVEELNAALSQLAEWGNLESQPDTARVASLNDFYRARFLYRLSKGGEATEAALNEFAKVLHRQAELQTVALEDIASRLQALAPLIGADGDAAMDMDAAKIHAILRDLVRVFEGLAENAQAFMAGVARGIELQQADATALIAYKRQLIDYLERFMGDLVRRSDAIGRLIRALSPRIDPALRLVAGREAQDAAPGDRLAAEDELARRWQSWRERWIGLSGWFLPAGHEPSQAELLRARARAAIPQLLVAITAINERRSGRSDRSADFRVLASWFIDCADEAEAHRLARAAFALNPARHFSLGPAEGQMLPATTRWADAPPLLIHPRLREYGAAAPRGPLPGEQDRSQARALLAAQLAEESRQIEAARLHLATGRPTRLSELGTLDVHSFGLFLDLLGRALSAQGNPDEAVEVVSTDGLLHVRLDPLEAGSIAQIRTPAGVFAGRDHLLSITRMEDGARRLGQTGSLLANGRSASRTTPSRRPCGRCLCIR